jgi:hypothetical protein
MLKQSRGIVTITLISLLSSPAQSFAQSSNRLYIATAYAKGNGRFSVVVKDTPNTRLEIYVNDKHPTKATVNKHGWATFNKVQLSDGGKLSFTKVLKDQHGTYQQPVAYTKRYTVKKDTVSFSNYIIETTTINIQSIPFATTTVSNASLSNGTTQTKTQGVNGSKKLTYQVTYIDSQETARTLVSTAIVVQPVTEIIENGTYVAPTPKLVPTAAPSPAPISGDSCHPLTDGGNCYESGEYCRETDHGIVGVAGDGKSIVCTDNDGWRWEPN